MTDEELIKRLDGAEEPDELIARGIALVNRAAEIEADPLVLLTMPREPDRFRRHAYDLFTLANTLNNSRVQRGQVALMTAGEAWLERVNALTAAEEAKLANESSEVDQPSGTSVEETDRP